MAEKNQSWFAKFGRWFTKLGRSIVPNYEEALPQALTSPITNERILNELITCFNDSVKRESVGSSLLFNAHYLVILHPETYEDRINALPVVVGEAVSAFDANIHALKAKYSKVSPIAKNWFFKFGAGSEFEGEEITPTDIRVIGALTGLLPGSGQSFDTTSKVKATRRINQTNRYEKVDIDLSAFINIDFREPGAFVVKFNLNGQHSLDGVMSRPNSGTVAAPASADFPRSVGSVLANISYHIGDKNESFTYNMRDQEIVIARKEPDNLQFPNYLLIESGYVSNPHARIRYDEPTRTFQIASFTRNDTRVNEQIVPRTDPADPTWQDLPKKAQILLNSMVTLYFQSNF